MMPVLRVILVTLQMMKDLMINQTVSFYMSIEFSLNVFIEFKGFEPATSCVSDQGAATGSARHTWETGPLNWLQFMLQWFIIFLGFTEFTKYLSHLGKNPNVFTEKNLVLWYDHWKSYSEITCSSFTSSFVWYSIWMNLLFISKHQVSVPLVTAEVIAPVALSEATRIKLEVKTVLPAVMIPDTQRSRKGLNPQKNVSECLSNQTGKWEVIIVRCEI